MSDPEGADSPQPGLEQVPLPSAADPNDRVGQRTDSPAGSKLVSEQPPLVGPAAADDRSGPGSAKTRKKLQVEDYYDPVIVDSDAVGEGN